MARSTKKELTTQQLDQLFTQLNTTIARLDVKGVQHFVSELLGPEEHIMIAKRLATIILLVEGNTLYRTSKVLQISTSTAGKISAGLKLGKYNEILILFGKSKKDYFAILNTLDSILHLGGIMPHRNGLERYRGL